MTRNRGHCRTKKKRTERAFDMFLKLHPITSKVIGDAAVGFVFCSRDADCLTDVAEMFTYAAFTCKWGRLRKQQISKHFDSWVLTFGEPGDAIGPRPDGRATRPTRAS